MNPGEDVSSLLLAMNKGDTGAESKLIPLVYKELRKLAAHYMRRERANHTLQPTALVHEAYLRLVNQHRAEWQNKAHFFAIAGSLMRRILIDHARAHTRDKRGGMERLIALTEVPPPTKSTALAERSLFAEYKSEELLDLDHALTQFAKEYPRASQIVEMRFFAGMTVEEIASVLNISPKTVKRDWTLARAWLRRGLRQGHTNDA
jgi:RNA polymerase sigma factor (TIGR02999 family)